MLRVVYLCKFGFVLYGCVVWLMDCFALRIWAITLVLVLHFASGVLLAVAFVGFYLGLLLFRCVCSGFSFECLWSCCLHYLVGLIIVVFWTLGFFVGEFVTFFVIKLVCACFECLLKMCLRFCWFGSCFRW